MVVVLYIFFLEGQRWDPGELEHFHFPFKEDFSRSDEGHQVFCKTFESFLFPPLGAIYMHHYRLRGHFFYFHSSQRISRQGSSSDSIRRVVIWTLLSDGIAIYILQRSTVTALYALIHFKILFLENCLLWWWKTTSDMVVWYNWSSTQDCLVAQWRRRHLDAGLP